MKYKEIVVIKEALEKLGKEPSDALFEIAKNIRICNVIIDEATSLAKDIISKYADREEDGKIKEYPETNGQNTMRVTDPEKMLQLQNNLANLENQEHEVTFVKFSMSKLKNLTLTLDMLIPLIDVIISE